MSLRRTPYDALRSMISDTNTSVTRNAQITRTIYHGVVVDNNDPDNTSRLRIFIPDLDQSLENKKEQLAWCQYFFASNIQYIPKIGEQVAVILENPWKKDHGRWWIGPIAENRTIAIPLDSVALTARPGNSVELTDTGNIEISTDIAKKRLEADVTIFFDKENKELRLASEDIVLESTITDGGEEFAIPYGERLVELLRFMLQTLKTHSHPPNSPPTPDFFVQADRYLRDIESFLLNKNVRTRGE